MESTAKDELQTILSDTAVAANDAPALAQQVTTPPSSGPRTNHMVKHTKEEWLKSFQGATLILEPQFGSPKVNHMFKRNFDHMGRSAFFISVRGRILLGEEQVSQAEQYIYDRIGEISKALDRKIEAAKAIMLDAGITAMAVYNKPVQHQATVVSPMQTHYLKLLKKADDLLMYFNTLLLHGEMAEREHSKRELEIKQHMRTIPSTIRKVMIGLRNRLMEAQAKEAGKEYGKSVVTSPADAVNDTEAAAAPTVAESADDLTGIAEAA